MRTQAPGAALPASTEPPWLRITAATIASPRPDPPPPRAGSARLKRSKARGRKSSGKPAPWSRTVIATMPAPISSAASSTARRRGAARCRPGPRWPARALAGRRRRRAPRGIRRRSGGPRGRRGGASRAATAPQQVAPRRRGRCRGRRRPSSARASISRSSASRHRRSVSSPADARAAPSSLGAAVAEQRHLDLALQDRQGGPQLVARIGDEAALGGDRVALGLPGSLEPIEHRVERRGEAPELVGDRRLREAAIGDVGDLLGPPAHGLDRPQRDAGDGVARRAGHDEGGAEPHQLDQEQRREGLVVVVPRRSDDRDDGLVPGSGGPGQQAQRLVERRVARAVDEYRPRQCPAQGSLVEQRRRPRKARGDHGPVRTQDLSDALVALEARHGGRAEALGRAGHRGRHRGRPGAQAAVQGAAELRLLTEVDERADGHQDDQERDGEGQGHLPADREAAHGAPGSRSRYPTPRTVSIEAVPNGRSILSRR